MRIVFVCAHLQHCFLDHSHSSEKIYRLVLKIKKEMEHCISCHIINTTLILNI